MNPFEPLFKPFTYKGLHLPNRVVMAPMTRRKSPGQRPDEDVVAYYRRRAEGGVGLILTEGTSPEHYAASNSEAVPAFFGEAALAGWAKVAAAVKAAGASIIPQLWHLGQVRSDGAGPYPDAPSVGPSGLKKPDEKVGEPMTESQIAEVIEGFAKSAVYAKDLGFDGVEIHGAHGYLVDQFLWSGTNVREDAYGGSLARRLRFAVDIVAETRRRVGPDFPILFRFSQWKQQDYGAKVAATPAELEAFLTPLRNAGVDIFDCSTRRVWEPEFPETGSDLNLAGWTKKLVGSPTISVGSVSLDSAFMDVLKDGSVIQASQKAEIAPMDRCMEMFERGDFDLLAVGRSLISNPDWASVVRDGRMQDLKPYDPTTLTVLY